jgi:hypothetical protein
VEAWGQTAFFAAKASFGPDNEGAKKVVSPLGLIAGGQLWHELNEGHGFDSGDIEAFSTAHVFAHGFVVH